MRWVRHDAAARLPDLTALLPRVRFPMVWAARGRSRGLRVLIAVGALRRFSKISIFIDGRGGRSTALAGWFRPWQMEEPDRALGVDPLVAAHPLAAALRSESAAPPPPAARRDAMCDSTGASSRHALQDGCGERASGSDPQCCRIV